MAVNEYTFYTLEECQEKLKEIQKNHEVVSYSIVTNYRIGVGDVFRVHKYVLVVGILADKMNLTIDEEGKLEGLKESEALSNQLQK